MTCTKCKHKREITRLLQEEERLREICSKCTLGEGVAGDGSVSLDHIKEGTANRILKVALGYSDYYTFDPGEIDEPPQEPDPETKTRETLQTLLACVAELPYEHVARLAQVADIFKTLTRPEFEIVAHLLNGGTMIGYAEAHGLTKQTAFARIKTLFKTHPIFRAIANGGLTHGKGGRQATPREYHQEDFFGIMEGDGSY